MKVCYTKNVNIELGLLGRLHPFDGEKFRKVFETIQSHSQIEIISPSTEISEKAISKFVDPLIGRYLHHKEHIFRALEIPQIPFINFNFLDKKILNPMRWAAAGTLHSAHEALRSGFCWNLGGGFHHASQHSIEGFCVYNDIGIAYQELITNGLLNSNNKILIIDTDAHHGNGNARTFMENKNVTILDIYNRDIYPTIPSTRQRVDISIPLASGISGADYLTALKNALSNITANFDLAFVVAGTDVLATDKLGGFELSIDDVVQREIITFNFLKERKIPGVFLSGGGYSKDSATAIARSIISCL